MANGGLTVPVANLVMTKYKNLIVDCVPKASGEFNQVGVETVKTNRYEWRIKVRGSTSMGATVEAADFQAPDSPETVTTFSGYTIFNGNYQLSDVAKAVIDGSETNFASALRYLVEDAMDQSLLFREGFFYGNGTGEVGTIASVASPNVRVIGYAAGRSVNPSVLVMEGGYYDVYDSTLATNRGQIKVNYKNNAPQSAGTAIDVVCDTTVGLPAGTTAGDRLFWVGQPGGVSSFGLVPQGLNSIIDNDVSGTFQGVTFATTPRAGKWVSSVLSNSGTLRPMTATIMNQAIQAQAEVYTGRPIDQLNTLKWIANEVQAIPFYNMFPGSATAATPLVTRPDDMAVGNSARTFNGPLGTIKLNFRRECPFSTVYGTDYSNMVNAERLKLDWRDPSVFMLNPNAATRIAQLYAIFQMCVKERRHMVRIDDLSYTLVSGNRG